MGLYAPPRRFMRSGSAAARCLSALASDRTADEVAAEVGLTREQTSQTLSRLTLWGWVIASGPAGMEQTGCTRRYRRR